MTLNISETVRDTYIVTKGIYTRPTEGCHFKCPRVT